MEKVGRVRRKNIMPIISIRVEVLIMKSIGFFEEAMSASKEVAEKYKSSLTENTGDAFI